MVFGRKKNKTNSSKSVSGKLNPRALKRHLKASVSDFPECDFSGQNLSGIDFTQDEVALNFSGSNFNGSNLSDCTFSDAIMIGCSFRGANLSNIKITGGAWSRSDFYEANLQGAVILFVDMIECFFGHANISFAQLLGVNLNGSIMFLADLRSTSLGMANLPGVREATMRVTAAEFQDVDSQIEVLNRFGNIVDEETLRLTVFLIGKRSEILADKNPVDISLRTFSEINEIMDFLELTTLSGERLAQFRQECLDAENRPSVFISYSTKDTQAVESIHLLLSKTGCSIWFAPIEMKAGGDITAQLNAAIDTFTYVIPVLSRNSIASQWVGHEMIRAKRREQESGLQVLYPVRITGYEDLQDWQLKDPDTNQDYAAEFREMLIPDFSMWKDSVALQIEFVKFARQLKLI